MRLLSLLATADAAERGRVARRSRVSVRLAKAGAAGSVGSDKLLLRRVRWIHRGRLIRLTVHHLTAVLLRDHEVCLIHQVVLIGAACAWDTEAEQPTRTLAARDDLRAGSDGGARGLRTQAARLLLLLVWGADACIRITVVRALVVVRAALTGSSVDTGATDCAVTPDHVTITCAKLRLLS